MHLRRNGTREQRGNPGDSAAPDVAIGDRPAVRDDSEDSDQPARDNSYAWHIVWRGDYRTGRDVDAKGIGKEER